MQRLALPVVPPYVEYSLTTLGTQAATKLETVVDWIEDNLPQIMDFKRGREAQDQNSA